ncbi:putative bifunctional diguanylate cyclase/phosphodiesterase [Actimicrobium sp. CCI2.3]|uniref:putative bifunctional diguanylate cyclase/phosphodiesterase n=1 Tax=Actimicrobium sp. CCI2.3 TaxID=3048616 RepID=UPI002AB548DD|nr:EAL domain-containing protein [Actimicrobium sp. CCI2.3]MDY7574222.1 EAL domain-containing protein [Actimicrobium sp. CCI2.3]MEB0022778.1 EAL domain-containing protein [Actimicrobium sp. CCI2.3]
MGEINALHALSAEPQRREEWYSLLGELSHHFWFAGDVSLMLQGFCKALVTKAGYVSVRVALNVENQSKIYEANADQPPLNGVLQHLLLPLAHHGVSVAQLQVSATFDLSDGSQAHAILMRIARELVEAILALTHSGNERDLLSNAELLALSVRQSPFPVVITNAMGQLEYCNDSYCRTSGYTSDELIGTEVLWKVSDAIGEQCRKEIAALQPGQYWQGELQSLRKDATQFWNAFTISPINDASSAQTKHFVGVINVGVINVDVINGVSDQLNYQKELEYQTTRDRLTGLANRNLLNDRIAQGIASAKRNNLLMGLMLLDLDHFKSINDASGHGDGDHVLKEVSKRLIGCVGETDTVARLGGDEFVILLTDLPEMGDVDIIAEKILIALSKPLSIGEQDVVVTASIGISCYPRDGDHGEILLRYAGIAMYRVKEHGRNGVRQFVPETGVTATRNMNMEDAMRRGLERDEFRLHYQPKMDLGSGRMVGAEALVRWQHPQIGLIHPIEFLTLAEESGLILPLGEWVLAQACRQQVAWEKEGIAGVQIAVNISPRQFHQEDFAERVKAIFSETGVDPARIILELTESIVMHDVSTTNATLKELDNLGLVLSLDNFGAGYVSLVHLRKHHISELKIDKSLINDIHTNPDNAAIVGAIIAMDTSMGLQVVAQGVENLAQVELLRQLGCKYVQGYYFGRPLECA